jgi:transposase
MLRETLAESDQRQRRGRRRHFVAVRVAEVNAVKRLLRAAGLGDLSGVEWTASQQSAAPLRTRRTVR